MQGTTEVASCLGTFALDLSFRSVFSLRGAEHAWLGSSCWGLSLVIAKADGPVEPSHVLLNAGELLLAHES